jgi:hypothetical protein
VSDLRRALAQRREQLSKSFGQNSGSRQASSHHQGQEQSQGQGRGAGKEQGPGQQLGQEGQVGDSEHASRGVEGDAAASRGGGANELVFGGQAEMDPDRLAFDALPPGHGGEGQELFGLRAANPKANPNPQVAPGSGAAAVGAQGAGYDEGVMRPRNRMLVQRYFDTP